ncbi:hypothetical protein GEMRC1_011284 [Eukaryota sp. GEM-RC1]
MFNCFDTSFVQFSVNSATFEVSSMDTMEVTTGYLFGAKEFTIFVEYFVDFNFLISIPVTSFVARNTPYVCFVGVACEIEVYSYLESFSFIETFIEPNVPDSIFFLYFGSTESSAVVTFISFVSGVPHNLQICAHFGCFPIFNIPFIVEASYVSPKFIQSFNESITTEILVEVEGISFYNFSVIQNSFYFENCHSRLSLFSYSSLFLDVEFSSDGNFSLMGLSFANSFPLNLFVEVLNYLTFPP